MAGEGFRVLLLELVIVWALKAQMKIRLFDIGCAALASPETWDL